MSDVINKEALVGKIAQSTGETAASTARTLDSFFEVVGDAIGRGEKIVITGWLTFERGHRAARQGLNPRTGEKIQIAATNTAKVKAGSKLKDRAKNG